MIFFILIILAYLSLNAWIFSAVLKEAACLPLYEKIIISIVFWFMALAFVLMQLLRDKQIPPTVGHIFYSASNGWLVFFLYTLLLFTLATILKCCGVHIPHALLYCVGLSVIVITYGYIHFTQPVINRIEIKLNGSSVPKHKMRIVAVSDIHLGYGITRSRLEKYVEMINNEKPDAVVIGGDMIDMTVIPLNNENMQEVINKINAPMGIYMVLGNHEYLSGVDKSMTFINKTKITLLRDSVATLPNGLQFVGRDDRTNIRRQQVSILLKSTDKTKPVFVIDHQPRNEEVDEMVKDGIDIGFFGHTHRGQVWPINLITDIVYDQSYGYKTRNKSHIYVSSGLGLWGPPFRIGTDSEFAVMDIEF